MSIDELSARLGRVYLAGSSSTRDSEHGAYQPKQAHWKCLDQQPSNEILEIALPALCTILKVSLQSFKLHAIADTQEIQSILSYFQAAFEDMLFTIEIPACDPLAKLIHEASEVVSMPFDVALFLRVWFTRAINFAATRQCDVLDTDHYGLHRHGDILFYNTTEWELDEEESGTATEIQLMNNLNAMERALENMGLDDL